QVSNCRIRDLGFQPGIDRGMASLNEINGVYFGNLHIIRCGFGTESFKLGTCIRLGNSGHFLNNSPADSGPAYLSEIKAPNFAAFVYMIQVIDGWIYACSTDALNPAATTVTISGGCASKSWFPTKCWLPTGTTGVANRLLANPGCILAGGLIP